MTIQRKEHDGIQSEHNAVGDVTKLSCHESQAFLLYTVDIAIYDWQQYGSAIYFWNNKFVKIKLTLKTKILITALNIYLKINYLYLQYEVFEMV